MIQTLTLTPIPVLIRRIAVPASVGFFFNTMFNAVDTWYGGRVSTQALAAHDLQQQLGPRLADPGAGILHDRGGGCFLYRY